MVEVANSIDVATSSTLLTFDELGSATAVAEGRALARAVIQHCNDNGIPTVVTTHFDLVVSGPTFVHLSDDHNVIVGAHVSDGCAYARAKYGFV